MRGEDKPARCGHSAQALVLAKSMPLADTSGPKFGEDAMAARARIGLLVVILTAGSGAAQAQGYTADQQALCSGDAMRLCSSAIPDVGRITACMVRSRTQLSPGCAQFFRPVRSISAKTRKPVAKPRSSSMASKRSN
ncbi:MAG: hypothetical protein NT113_18295 [Hyphomicrobiales bacterium]|nr:hypothetical protein [Hyphomicrobiales bacterium]